MDMIDMSVTLIVKAPNQQIEDQTIKCEPTWTIKKLKGYLSEVYPSKPRTEDQKLIYSGQLLPDSVILRDILRWYEGQETHTVHLVCTPPRDFGRRASPRPQVKMSERPSTTSAEESGGSSANVNPAESAPTDGLRRRLSPSSAPCTQSVGTSVSDSHLPPPDSGAAWAAAVAQPYPGLYDPNNMMQQLALMQQAYAHYMTQYMQMMASGASVPQPGLPGAPAQPLADQPAAPAINQDQDAGNDLNVAEGGEEEGRANRDWLDWFYFMSRLMVLFSIVYFYSSPTRFIIVSALAIMMYLYQVGFFRLQQQQQQQPQQQPPQQPVLAARVAENNNAPVEVQPVANDIVEPNEADETARRGEEGSGEMEEPAAEQERPSLLAITWTFFTSFFASLIPEQPGAI